MQAGWCLLLGTQVWATVYHTNPARFLYLHFPGSGGKKWNRFSGYILFSSQINDVLPALWVWNELPAPALGPMAASCLCRNSQQDPGLQATQIIVLTRPSCRPSTWEPGEEGLLLPRDSLAAEGKWTLGSHVSEHVVWCSGKKLLKCPCGQAWRANGQEMLSV